LVNIVNSPSFYAANGHVPPGCINDPSPDTGTAEKSAQPWHPGEGHLKMSMFIGKYTTAITTIRIVIIMPIYNDKM
jgi:hypothetical protein